MQPFRYKPKLNTGKLNRRITIQKKGPSEDESGYPIPNPPWIDIMTVWASREPLRGREYFAAAAVQAETTVRYKIRYREGIKSYMRLIDLKDNRIYELDSVIDDPFNDRTETHLMAIEASNG